MPTVYQPLYQVKGIDRATGKTDEVPALMELTFQWQKTYQQINNIISDSDKHRGENAEGDSEEEWADNKSDDGFRRPPIVV